MAPLAASSYLGRARRGKTSTRPGTTAVPRHKPRRNDRLLCWLATPGPVRTNSARNVNLTRNSDPQCSSGWPFGTKDPTSATSCPTAQPTAGLCLNGAGAQNGTCNFASPLCPASFTCQPGPGAPKYGDYNASACAAGRLFAAWTSATTPSGSATPAAGLSTFTRTVQPRVP